MTPMSSSSSHNTSRRRPAATNAPRRRPLARSNSSLLGTIKNLVTAPLAWFATTDDFGDSPDLKGKRRRHPPPNSGSAADDSEDAPRSKRPRMKSPDHQIQFHPEPPYAAPAYPQPPSGYLDPPGSVFNNSNNFYPSNITASLNQYNSNTRSGLSRTMSIDPPHNSIPFSRDTPMNFTPLDRDTSMEASSFIRTSSSIPRDHSMPLPAARSSFRMRSSLTPQPVQPREASEPPPLSSLAQKPVFVRPPPDSHQRLSSQSSTSTLGSLVESQRSTRSPMRQHSSLLFGSGSQPQSGEANNTRQPAPAERALHELDIYKTPLLPTRSRLRSSASSPSDSSFPSNISKAVDPSDMFRPRRSSQLLLMRDDRRASALGRKSSYSFLDAEEVKEKEGKSKKAKVNETKPYAGEGGMKKLLARRMKEVQEDEQDDPESQAGQEPVEEVEESNRVISQPLPPLPAPSEWQKTVSSQPASSVSSLRVGRTKTSRAHIARPGRPSKKFSAAFEDEVDDFMDDGEDLERQRERQELEEAAKRLPTFEVAPGFTFAKEPNAKPVEHDANAKEPPIAALPFSFGETAVPAESVVPLSAPKAVPAAIPEPKLASAFSFERDAPSSTSERLAEPDKPAGDTSAVPNFFAGSKFLSQAPAPSTLLPPAIPSLGASDSTPSTESVLTPKPAASMMFPSTPAPASSLNSVTPTPTPVKDTENPLWEGDGGKKSNGGSSLFGEQVNGGGQPLFGKLDNNSVTSSIFGGSTSAPVSIFGAAKKDESTTSLFGAPKPGTSGFSFGTPSGGEGSSTSAATSLDSSKADAVKPIQSFGSMTSNAGAPAGDGPPKAPAFPSFGQAASTPAVDAVKPPMFGAPAPASNLFASSAAPEAPKPAFGGFSFSQTKEAPKSSPATSSPFTFGAPTSAPTAPESGKPASSAPFSFGTSIASAPASTPAFSFGTSTPEASKPTTPVGGMFSFGTPTAMLPTARPVTPPRNDMQEFKMEESPTRDMQVNAEVKPAEPRPTLGGAGSGFSFSNPSTSGSIFGQAPAAAAPAPFSFGASASPNPFAAPATTENKPFGSSDFGRPPSTSTPFAFGQNNAPTPSIDPPRPSTTGSFSFGSSGPSSSTGFTFGGGNQAPSNPFTLLPSGGSAPSSPSTFNQPFSFGAAAPQQSGSFSFGSSQPVSPAGGASNLPQPTTPGGFGSGFGAQPSSPFSAAPPAQPAGGSLFTIGAAPPPAPAGNAPRMLKKLPRRKNN
ncbi:hypothetical protein B0H11DRAFT_2086957 [Mycena galericulata]|nr:hypothetical protein B0H11DRAFT_2086957 [Mycena galericulata]